MDKKPPTDWEVVVLIVAIAIGSLAALALFALPRAPV